LKLHLTNLGYESGNLVGSFDEKKQ
jgi:hypothetical protein